ncbi:MAG: DUF4126 domain-containing protein [Betaproteobacteria bacterium]
MNLDTTHLIAIAAALGWASGLRLYAVVFLTGMAGHAGLVALPPGLQVLQQPLVLWASGALLAIEFVVDKVPWLDSLWDAVHTLVRIPAGALLAASVFGGDHESWAIVAGLAGGTLAATSHAAKATTRAAANTSPEPFSNLALSLAGDVAVPSMLWLSWGHPWLFLAVLALVVVAMVALTARLLRFVGVLARRLRPRVAAEPAPDGPRQR